MKRGGRRRLGYPADHDAFVARLQATIELFGTTNGLAKAAGLSEGALRKWAHGVAEPTRDRLVAIASAANVRVEWLATGRGPQRSLGDAGLPVLEGYLALPWLEGEGEAEEPAPIAFHGGWLEQGLALDQGQLRLLRVPDASMEPLMAAGGLAVVDGREAVRRRDGIHAVRISGNTTVRRLQSLPGDEVEVSAANPSFRPFRVAKADPHFAVLGRIVWVGGPV